MLKPDLTAPVVTVLASGSPRRTELLKEFGIEHIIIKATTEESFTSSDPERMVKGLAIAKAYNVCDMIKKNPSLKGEGSGSSCIIAADTLVFLDGKELGKPADREESRSMIKSLSGRDHEVWTGVCILVTEPDGEPAYEDTFAERTFVHVRELTDEEIDGYVASGEGDDKAGAYAIQGEFGKFIDRFVGSRNNVIGLPAEKVAEKLKEIGVIQAP